MSELRAPAVAGYFYPGEAAELRATIMQMLDAAPAYQGPRPKAIIVPHAGYVYSGPVAATAYASLRPWCEQITRVVLLGPAHRVGFHGLAASSAKAFRTPLGDISLDSETLSQLNELPQLTILDQAHAMEHSLEVQLPFLQCLLGEFKLLPLVVGEASATEVAEVLEQVWGDEKTLIVISSDLSHYHDYDSARQRDHASSEAIEGLNGEAIGYEDACGRNPLRGLLRVAKRKGMQARTLDLRNSGDTAGPRDRVVGYGAYVVTD
jgi:AmmeMemoRadiSam system protein B